LVYARELAIDEVLAPFVFEDTSTFKYELSSMLLMSVCHISERRLDDEGMQLEAKKREREEQQETRLLACIGRCFLKSRRGMRSL